MHVRDYADQSYSSEERMSKLNRVTNRTTQERIGTKCESRACDMQTEKNRFLKTQKRYLELLWKSEKKIIYIFIFSFNRSVSTGS